MLVATPIPDVVIPVIVAHDTSVTTGADGFVWSTITPDPSDMSNLVLSPPLIVKIPPDKIPVLESVIKSLFSLSE